MPCGNGNWDANRISRLIRVCAVLVVVSILDVAKPAGAKQKEQEPLAFVTADTLRPVPAQPPFPASLANSVADAWMSQLDPADPRLAAGAISLIEDAPPELVAAIAKRLDGTDRLNKVMEKASLGIRDRILNAGIMNVAKLRDYASFGFEVEFRKALAAADSARIASLASFGFGFRHLPPAAVNDAVNAIDGGKLPPQARREVTNLLLTHADDLKLAQRQFERWLNDTGSSPVAQEKRDLALTALLLLRAPVGEDAIVKALRSDDLMLMRAAIGFLRSQASAPLKVEVADEVFRLMRHETRLPDWSSAYEVLRLRIPVGLESLYAEAKPETLKQMWPAELAAEWILRATPTQLPHLAALPLDLYDPPKADLADCNTLRFQLAVLGARADLGKPTLADFWERIVLQPHKCRDELGQPIDGYLKKAGKEPMSSLASLGREQGLGQLPEWHAQSKLLSRALGGNMSEVILAKDWPTAKLFLRARIAPDQSILTQREFWSRPAPANADPGQIYLSVLQASSAAPESAYQHAAKIAAAQAEEGMFRSTALLAIASGGRLVRYQDLFTNALLDKDALVAKTAAILLAKAYDEGLPESAFRDPGKDVIENALLTEGIALTEGSARHVSNLLARLPRYKPSYASMYAAQANWKTPSASCFALAVARPLALDVGLRILGAKTTTEDMADTLGSCVLSLYDGNSPLAYVVRNAHEVRTSDAPALLSVLQGLWEDPAFANTDNTLRATVATIVANAAAAQPFDLEGLSALNWWRQRLEKERSPVAGQLRAEYWKRTVIGILVAVPTAVVVHLGVWGMLLTAYPRSRTLQAIVFWNPFVRKVLGFGYVDLVLLYVPIARRRLFAPFAPEFLRDIHASGGTAFDERGYFEGSLVEHRSARVGAVVSTTPQRIPITVALRNHQGRVLLLGKSGLGKSSYLRYWLSLRASVGADVLVYLRADQCKSGVETEIERRMQGIGSDQKMLRSVIYSGRMYVYIDGYNEVDLATQEAITAFVGDYPRGNIMVTSQIPLRGFSSIETFEITPLNREQISEFLSSRTAILAPDSPVQGESFQRLAQAFLDDVWRRPVDEDEARAFEEILANPMDLTSVALLLSQGGLPDLFALEKQQFDVVKRQLKAKDLQFRTLVFSNALLEQRLKDEEDLGALPFKPEVAELIAAKLAQVRTFSDPAGKTTSQEVRFRHDRIRDFFTHFGLLELSPEEQAAKASDARFAGVFPYLARSMPRASAEALREQLVTLAANIEDHRVSDMFVREFSWRQRLASSDPDWMLTYDLAAARIAEQQYAQVEEERSRLNAQIGSLRDEIARSRRYTRVLTAVDPAELARLSREMLIAFGATEAERQSALGTTLVAPHGTAFVLLAVTQQDIIRDFHVALIEARLDKVRERTLVVLNVEVHKRPSERAQDAEAISRIKSRDRRVAVMFSWHLYDFYRHFVDEPGSGERVRLWTELQEQWGGGLEEVT